MPEQEQPATNLGVLLGPGVTVSITIDGMIQIYIPRKYCEWRAQKVGDTFEVITIKIKEDEQPQEKK